MPIFFSHVVPLPSKNATCPQAYLTYPFQTYKIYRRRLVPQPRTDFVCAPPSPGRFRWVASKQRVKPDDVRVDVPEPEEIDEEEIHALLLDIDPES